MANARYKATHTAALTAATARTVIELATASTSQAVICSWWVEMDASAAAGGAKVELVKVTGRTSPTSSNLTAQLAVPGIPAAVSTPKNYTVEGTGSTSVVYENHYVSPTSGVYVQYPLGREQIVAVSDVWGIRVTTAASSTPNYSCGVEWEE